MTIENAAELLSAAGKRSITAEQLREDIAAGAPTNGDGTLHLVHYAAWLASQAGQQIDP